MNLQSRICKRTIIVKCRVVYDICAPVARQQSTASLPLLGDIDGTVIPPSNGVKISQLNKPFSDFILIDDDYPLISDKIRYEAYNTLVSAELKDGRWKGCEDLRMKRRIRWYLTSGMERGVFSTSASSDGGHQAVQ
ncbi:hypothetical protein KQX54_020126 [Cotesia glomerata]|uniref:Uncharacterized protein n=1 Tax=Cotesia glomerata TaxID=32391 RepID=A0AAV7HZA7_COTGL|nr:hypothetical protein KQX54_020126 [Cotesia glomerata]